MSLLQQFEIARLSEQVDRDAMMRTDFARKNTVHCAARYRSLPNATERRTFLGMAATP
jgi:hypothetical protein